MFVLVVVVLLVSVKMAPAWRSVTLSPFSTFTQGTVSHKAQGHTKNTVTCTCSHTKHTVTQAPYKVHLTQSTQSHRPTSHKAQSHMHTITQGTVTHAHHHTRYKVTPSHKAQDHTRHTSRLTIRDNLTMCKVMSCTGSHMHQITHYTCTHHRCTGSHMHTLHMHRVTRDTYQ